MNLFEGLSLNKATKEKWSLASLPKKLQSSVETVNFMKVTFCSLRNRKLKISSKNVWVWTK